MPSFPLRIPVLLVVLLLAPACKTRDAYYCEGAPNNNCLLSDADLTCSRSSECPGDRPVCDVGGAGICVQCTPAEREACGPSTPACRDNTCQACVAHTECDSGACLPDGSCGDAGQVAYVQAGGTGASPCAQGAPCGTLQQGVDSNRPYIKVAMGTLVGADVTTIGGRAVTILADPGAKLDRTGDGRILLVRSAGANVSIYDLEITGQTGPADEAIQLEPNGGTPVLSLVRVKVTGNQGRGISSTGGSLTVSQSTLSGNQGGGITASGSSLTVSQSTISGNAGGGISMMSGTFSIVGNVFFANGTLMGPVGGVSISTAQDAANRLEFNSFHGNQTQLGVGSAIQCVAGTFTARNNIMSQNGTITNMEQVGGPCTHTYSIVRPGTVPPGAGNSSMDPMFVNSTTGDLHLKPGSPALGAADPSSDLTGPAARDIDGDMRTHPADIGADEAL
jgi:hypothetical protein